MSRTAAFTPLAPLTLAALVAALAPGCPEEPTPTDGGGFVPITLAIVSFTATPESVAAGGTVTLAWESTGAARCSIEPELGVVPRSGSVDVIVTTSTSFTLSCDAGADAVTEGLFVAVTGDAGPQPLDGGPLDGGALTVTGAGQIIDAPASVLPGELETGDELFAFWERHNVTLTADLPCDAHVAATYDDTTYSVGCLVPAGTRVDVLWVNFQPASSDGGTNAATATFTFPQEVAGIVTLGETMRASQAVAHPSVSYPPIDGGAFPNFGLGVTDSMTLAADRKTLTLSAEDVTRDALRVITYAAGQAPVRITSPNVVVATLDAGPAPDGGGRVLDEGTLEGADLFLLEESSGVTLAAALDVDLAAPGDIEEAAPDAGLPAIGPGTVDTVVLHFDPAGTGSAIGTITFARRVLGVAGYVDQLDDTGAVLPNPFTFGATSAPDLEGSDVLTLFADERSLYLDFGIAVDDTVSDNVRVFLEPLP